MSDKKNGWWLVLSLTLHLIAYYLIDDLKEYLFVCTSIILFSIAFKKKCGEEKKK